MVRAGLAISGPADPRALVHSRCDDCGLGDIMKKPLRAAAASIFGLVLVMSPISDLHAAELKVLAGGSLTGPLNELGPQFERASGHKLVIHFDSTPNLIKLATSAPFDLGVVPVDVFKNAEAKARFAPGPTTDIARVG